MVWWSTASATPNKEDASFFAGATSSVPLLASVGSLFGRAAVHKGVLAGIGRGSVMMFGGGATAAIISALLAGYSARGLYRRYSKNRCKKMSVRRWRLPGWVRFRASREHLEAGPSNCSDDGQSWWSVHRRRLPRWVQRVCRHWEELSPETKEFVITVLAGLIPIPGASLVGMLYGRTSVHGKVLPGKGGSSTKMFGSAAALVSVSSLLFNYSVRAWYRRAARERPKTAPSNCSDDDGQSWWVPQWIRSRGGDGKVDIA